MIEYKQFNAKTVLPKDDRVLWDLVINRNGVVYGCELSHVAANQVSITAGFGVIKGGLFVVTAETIACAQTSSGSLPGRIYIKVDLANTSTPIQILTTCASPLPDLVQEDINITNGVYELELATYTASTTSISDLVTTVSTIENVNKLMLNTSAEVLANTEAGRVIDALVAKEIINSLNGEYLLLSDVFASGGILSATDVNVIKKNNQITISGTVYASVVSNTNVSIGVLKTAYKPIKRTTSCFSGTSPANYGVVAVSLDGTITLGANITNASYCAFNVTYLIA